MSRPPEDNINIKYEETMAGVTAKDFCSPPESCFVCPFSDCINRACPKKNETDYNNITKKSESEFLERINDYYRKRNKNLKTIEREINKYYEANRALYLEQEKYDYLFL